jgi:hypothetical protein
MKLLETETIFAFMDIGPIAKGHCLVIPKCKSSILELALAQTRFGGRNARLPRRGIIVSISTICLSLGFISTLCNDADIQTTPRSLQTSLMSTWPKSSQLSRN